MWKSTHYVIAQHRKSSISTFEEIFASDDKTFISGGELSTMQYFYGVLGFSWYFLNSEDPNS